MKDKFKTHAVSFPVAGITHLGSPPAVSRVPIPGSPLAILVTGRTKPHRRLKPLHQIKKLIVRI